jgi:hypothetical protein
MVARLRLLLTWSFAAAYAAQTIFLGVVHLASVDFCADRAACGPAACGASLQAQWSHCDHLHADCATQRDGQADHWHNESESRQTSPGHNRDDCSICRHLAVPTAKAELARLPEVGRVIAAIEPTLPVFFKTCPPRTRFSRGPPLENC